MSLMHMVQMKSICSDNKFVPKWSSVAATVYSLGDLFLPLFSILFILIMGLRFV